MNEFSEERIHGSGIPFCASYGHRKWTGGTGRSYAKALIVIWSGAKRNPEICRVIRGRRPIGDKLAEPRRRCGDDASLSVPNRKNVRRIRIVVDAAQFRRQIDPPSAVLIDRYILGEIGCATNELPIAES